MTIHSLEGALLEAEFLEFLKSVRDNDAEGAKRFAAGFRELLDKKDQSDRDETLGWLSDRVGKIEDRELFSKVVDFLVEHNLSSK